MTAHVHTWRPITARPGRYGCTCGAIGHKHPFNRGPIQAYACQHNIEQSDGGRSHCGADATYVTGQRQQSRCELHAPAQVHVNGTSLGASSADRSAR